MQFGDYRVEIIPDTEFRLDGGAMFGVVPRALWSKVCPPDEENRITMNMRRLVITKDIGFFAADKTAAKELYSKAWGIISADLPMLPLWYPSNIVIANKRINNIKMSGSGDWTINPAHVLRRERLQIPEVDVTRTTK